MASQLKLDLPEWGGKREGAGRPRTRMHPGLDGPGVPHVPRPELKPRFPVLVTLRVQPGVGYLRGYRRSRILIAAFNAAAERFGMRVVDYVILGNHLHLLVEADSAKALSRGMQGLEIRIAKQLNRLQRRSGGVFADRYHAHILKTPRETANAMRYLRSNYRRHTREHVEPHWDDPLAGRVAQPRTWLLRTAPVIASRSRLHPGRRRHG